MRKKIKSTFRLLDLFVPLFCIGVASYFVYLFWEDLNKVTIAQDREVIGLISQKDRVIQRKLYDRVVWERLGQNSELYDSDTIRTAEQARAVISFTDGTIMEVSENSMIQIHYADDTGLSIEVDGGGVSLDSKAATKNVRVRLDDGSTVQVEAGSSLRAESGGESGSSIEVTSGRAVLTTESGEQAEIEDGGGVRISEGVLKKSALTVLYPPRDLTLLCEDTDNVPIDFSIKGESGENETKLPVTVQISKTRNFSSLDYDETVVVDEGTFSHSVDLGEGIQYWRVFTKNAEEDAVVGKVTIERILPVQLLSPQQGSDFTYVSKKPSVSFRWTGSTAAIRYKLLVSKMPDMSNPVVNQETGRLSFITDSLDDGQWYFQVIPVYQNPELSFGISEIRSFFVTHREEALAPELSVPAEGTALTIADSESNLKSATFMWKSEISEADFSLLIARDSGFRDVVFTAQVSRPRLTVDFGENPLPIGTYYWKVIRYSALDIEDGKESEVRSFKVQAVPPVEKRLLYPPNGYSVERGKLGGTKFMWKVQGHTTSPTVIQISPDENFMLLSLERNLTANSLDGLLLQEGSYWWRIGIQKENGTFDFTEPWKFTVLTALDKPHLLIPKTGEELVSAAGSPIKIEWSKIDGASYYNVRINDETGTLLYSEDGRRQTDLTLELTPGSYDCRIQSVFEGTEISSPRTSTFSMENFTIRLPEPIRLVSPKNGDSIEGLVALRSGIDFSWTSGKDAATSYEFTLSRVNARGNLSTVEARTGKVDHDRITKLTPGTYRWRIRAKSKEGFSLDSQEYSFVVNEIPLLPEAQLVSPEKSIIMNTEYLRNHRTIEFSWHDVPNANNYTFTLGKRISSGQVQNIITRQMKGNQFVLTDLSILDLGTFEWTVTASTLASDGSVEQRGQVARRTFTIDFELPQNVEAVGPGTVYGE